eukprot:6065081-Prymnesium_polylepis.1
MIKNQVLSKTSAIETFVTARPKSVPQLEGGGGGGGWCGGDRCEKSIAGPPMAAAARRVAWCAIAQGHRLPLARAYLPAGAS